MPVRHPADSAAVRRHNLALVLRHLADHGPCSRTQLSAATGLVHASVTTLTADLIERGLAREAGLAPSGGGRGRPRRQLELVPERALAIAVRIGLERLETTVADLAGTVVTRSTVPYRAPYGDPLPLASKVADAVRAAVAEARTVAGAVLTRVVVAMPGPVSSDAAHTVAAATDFGWAAPVDLGALIAERLPELPCPLDTVNDANVAALAEYHALGGAPGTLVYVKADTGVGGGIITDGRIQTGAHGLAGEPGHMPVALDGPPCPCGARGCLALYLGPEALVEAAGLGAVLRREGVDAALSVLGRELDGGSPSAVAALSAAGETLGAAILAIVSLLDADEVVLGGYLADWHPWLADGIAARLSGRRALTRGLPTLPRPGVLGPDATLRGALGFARDAVLADPAAVPPLEGS